MTRLHNTLSALAEDAPETSLGLAERAIQRARRRRRTKWIIAPALAAAVAVAAVVAVPMVTKQPELRPIPQVNPLPERGAGPMKSARQVKCGKDCAQWWLTGRDGRQWRVDQALGTYLPKDKVNGVSTAPLVLSEDGGHLAYYRPSDRQLVVRDLTAGTVTPIATKNVPPGKDDIGFMALNLSADGSQVTIAFKDMDLGDGSDSRALYVDVASGDSARLPAPCCVRMITRDRVVMQVESRNKIESKDKIELITWMVGGWTRAKIALPKDVRDSGFYGALSADGRQLAVMPGKAMDRLEVIEVDTGKVSQPVKLALPAMRPIDQKKGTGTMQGVIGWLGPTTVRVDVYPYLLAILSIDDVKISPEGQKLMDKVDKTIHSYAVDTVTGAVKELPSYQFSRDAIPNGGVSQ